MSDSFRTLGVQPTLWRKPTRVYRQSVARERARRPFPHNRGGHRPDLIPVSARRKHYDDMVRTRSLVVASGSRAYTFAQLASAWPSRPRRWTVVTASEL
jgi:hypothetical protein